MRWAGGRGAISRNGSLRAGPSIREEWRVDSVMCGFFLFSRASDGRLACSGAGPVSWTATRWAGGRAQITHNTTTTRWYEH